MDWDWTKAQPAEFEFWRQWVDGRFSHLGGYENAISTYKKAKETGSYLASNRLCEMREFFNHDVSAWNEFAKSLTDKSCLEIGCACEGMVPFWYWVKQRTVIEPLMPQYIKLITDTAKSYGYPESDTWLTNDIKYISSPAEEVVPSLIGTINGAVVCRNVLDHCANPWGVLNNTLSYCAPGCTLLFWSDLWHEGGGDTGHCSITKDRNKLKEDISKSGFQIIRDVLAIHGPGRNPNDIEYGCVAIKK